MISRVRTSLTFSNVVACTALFIALGSGAYAAVQIPRNSVGTAQLKSNAVTSPKVKDASLLAKDFKSGQLPAGAPGPKGDTGAAGAAGPAGAAGANGTNGTDGAPGAKGDKGDTGDGFRWRGEFACDGVTIYQPRDVISYQGETWVHGGTSGIGGCVNPPFAPWALVAKKGTFGTVTRRAGTPVDIAANSASGASANCSPGEKAVGGGADPASSNLVFMSSSYPNSSDPTAWLVVMRNTSGTTQSVTPYAVCVTP